MKNPLQLIAIGIFIFFASFIIGASAAYRIDTKVKKTKMEMARSIALWQYDCEQVKGYSSIGYNDNETYYTCDHININIAKQFCISRKGFLVSSIKDKSKDETSCERIVNN